MILLLSPHNDDESLFCSYTIMRRKPQVVICTDSWIQYERGDGITAEERIAETIRAMGILGVEVSFLGIPDTELEEDKLVKKLVNYTPDKVYAPLPNSENVQHNLVGKVAGDLWRDKIVYYSTYTKNSLEPRGEIKIDPTTEEVERKNDALDCYKSQIRINNHHFLAVRGKPEFLNLRKCKKVSAVLLSWKRPKELGEIIEHLKTISFIDEIIIWHNYSKDNKISYGRYISASQAKNDIIYVQDDDCIIENIPEIFSTFDDKHLSNGIIPSRMKDYGNQRNDEPYSTLVGWGAFFKKDWISVFDQYIELFGEDELLYREADRIFTVLLARKHNTIPARIREFQSASDMMALWLQPDHFELGKKAVDRSKQIIHKRGIDRKRNRYSLDKIARSLQKCMRIIRNKIFFRKRITRWHKES